MNLLYRIAFRLIPIVLLILQQLLSVQPLQSAGECAVGNGYATIQDAVNDKICATVHLPAGTYTERVFIERDIAITGDGADLTVVDAQEGGSVFLILENVTVSLTGLTITGGTGTDPGDGNTYGGGILSLGSLTIVDSVIAKNRASMGGGIFTTQGSLSVNGSIVLDNKAEGIGGGIAIFEGDLTVQDSAIRDNSAESGGGILTYLSEVKVRNSTISANHAATIGGGLYFETEHRQTGNVSIEQSTIHGNSAHQAGGIYTNFGTLSVDKSTISANLASDVGGGIYAQWGNLGILNSTLSGNEAQQGGAIYLQFTRLVFVVYSTISENQAQEGGGLFAKSAMCQIDYNIFARNSGGSCSGDAMIISNGVNLIEDNSCRGGNTISGDPRLGPLADNGGATLTHALLAGSPALDAIPLTDERCVNAATSSAEEESVYSRDQRGIERRQGAGCDIGAYEWDDAPVVAESVIQVIDERKESDRHGISPYSTLIRAALFILQGQR